jgi:hypothetical protein
MHNLGGEGFRGANSSQRRVASICEKRIHAKASEILQENVGLGLRSLRHTLQFAELRWPTRRMLDSGSSPSCERATTTSAFGCIADEICSLRAFQLMTDTVEKVTVENL